MKFQQFLLLAVILILLTFNNLSTTCNYLIETGNTGPSIEELTQGANCIIVTQSSWKLTYYTSLLKDTNQFFAMTGNECMQYGAALGQVDHLRPVYLLIETSMFPDENGKLPGFELLILAEGEHLGLDYTKQEFLDYLVSQDWVTQIALMTSENGFTGSVELYRLN